MDLKAMDQPNGYAIDMEIFLQSTDVIDWHHPAICQHARHLAAAVPSSCNAATHGSLESVCEIAKICFEWVRDEIRHSFDYQINPITWRASDVLKHRTGYCYAKSHLLAALLRAHGIPAGFCYQRLSVDDSGPPYCLHGLNGILLPDIGWYRVDPRGNRPGVDAQFTPPREKLAFQIQWPDEQDFLTVLPDPLAIVVETLQTYQTWEQVLHHLPDIPLDQANAFGLMVGFQ